MCYKRSRVLRSPGMLTTLSSEYRDKICTVTRGTQFEKTDCQSRYGRLRIVRSCFRIAHHSPWHVKLSGSPHRQPTHELSVASVCHRHVKFSRSCTASEHCARTCTQVCCVYTRSQLLLRSGHRLLVPAAAVTPVCRPFVTVSWLRQTMQIRDFDRTAIVSNLFLWRSEI